MSRLEELIAELCPDGVEYKRLGEVVQFLNGRAYKMPELLSEGKYKVLRVGNFFTSDKWYYSNLELDEDKYCYDGDLLYAWAASLGPRIWSEDKTIFHYHIWKLKYDEKVVHKRYLYHFLAKDVLNIKQSLTNSTMPHVSMSNMKERIIPLPPLEVQSEIVRILDEYTEKNAELIEKLAAELDARKKQYEYYLKYLFAYDNSVTRYSLSEVATLKRGTYITQKDIIPGDIPVILGGQEPAYFSNTSNHEGEAVVMSRSGAYAGFVSYWSEPIFVTDGFIIENCEGILLKYIYFYLKSIQDKLHGMKKGGGVPHVRGDEIMLVKIPLPSLAEQERIVSILDRFDKLCNDITSGLPAEIEARRKQYEHYRDRLLTFKELES